MIIYTWIDGRSGEVNSYMLQLCGKSTRGQIYFWDVSGCVVGERREVYLFDLSSCARAVTGQITCRRKKFTAL